VSPINKVVPRLHFVLRYEVLQLPPGPASKVDYIIQDNTESVGTVRNLRNLEPRRYYDWGLGQPVFQW